MRWVSVIITLGVLQAQGPSSYQQYVTQMQAQYVKMYSDVAGSLRPRIPIRMQIVPATGSYLEGPSSGCNPSLAYGTGGACVFNTPQTLIAYYDSLKNNNSNMDTADLNIPLSPLIASTEYQTYCTANPTLCTLLNSNLSFQTKTLTNLDNLVSHIVSKGNSVHFSPTPDGPVSGASGCNFTGSTPMTGTGSFANCLNPLYIALVEHYATANFPGIIVKGVTMHHEPTGSFTQFTGVQLSAANYAILMGSTAAAVHGVASSVQLEGGFTTGATENTYVTALNGTSFITAAGVDIYGGNCVVSNFHDNILTAYLTTKGLMITNGWTVGVNETARPRYCNTGSSAGETNALIGCGDAIWSAASTGADDAYLTAITWWTAGEGFKWLSFFATEPYLYYTAYDPTGVSDNCQTGPFVTNLVGVLPAKTETAMTMQTVGVGKKITATGVFSGGGKVANH